MHCRFCFAQFKDIKELGKKDSISVVKRIADYGFRKINFVGGEPTLFPWLKDLLIEAKKGGLITSIVTNGWKIDEGWLKEYAEYLDWVGLSIDSLDSDVNRELGRIVSGFEAPGYLKYLDTLRSIRKYEIKLKINTVVTQLNKNELFHSLILEVQPDKWKIFQVSFVENENLSAIDLSINKDEFKQFISKHYELDSITEIYPEYCEDMKGSYLILDPAGRFLDNSDRRYSYSECILDVGIEKAIDQVKVSVEKFKTRKNRGRLKDIIADTIEREGLKRCRNINTP